MPKFKPLAPAVQSCVLGVVRAALRNPELRGRLAEPPWPQILLHLLYEGDPPTPVPLEEPEEKGKKVKDAKGPKGGKVKDAKDSKGALRSAKRRSKVSSSADSQAPFSVPGALPGKGFCRLLFSGIVGPVAQIPPPRC